MVSTNEKALSRVKCTVLGLKIWIEKKKHDNFMSCFFIL
ncbi:hypothetical protein BTJ45_00982 [Bacillus mycoides]|nr:hypothetical protein BTJ45_00982 [Bacillus mycoides]